MSVMLSGLGKQDCSYVIEVGWGQVGVQGGEAEEGRVNGCW